MQLPRSNASSWPNRSFAIYIRHVVLSRAQPQEPLPMVTNLQEIAMMISEKPGLWARQWEKEGIQKGQASLLERQLQRKFGHLPDEFIQRVRQGNESQLEAWSLNVLDATTLDDVFEE